MRARRLTRRLVLTSAAALTAACAASGAIGKTGRVNTIAPNPAGIQTGIYIDRPEGATGPLVYRRIKAAGATIVRFTISWRAVAPTTLPATWNPADPGDPNYSWGTYDQEITQAVRHGLTPLVTFLYTPAWAEVGGKTTQGTHRPTQAAIAQFATALATRYSGHFNGLPRVRYWQVWNEPNITPYLEPQRVSGKDVAAAYYRIMLDASAKALTGVSPSNIVVSAGLSPFTVDYRDVRSVGPLRFMRELLCMSGGTQPKPTCNAKATFDIWATHPYTSGGPFHHASNPDDVSLGDLPTMRTLLDAARKAGHVVSTHPVEFWVTEFSWDSKPPDPRGVPLALHARWTAEAIYQMWKSGVDALVWLMLRDDPYPLSPLQAGLYVRGKTLAGDRPKPALTAFRFPFVAYLNGTSVLIWGRTPGGHAGSVVVERQTGGAGPWRRVATAHADAHGIFTETMTLAATRTDKLRARLGRTTSLSFSLTQPPDHIVRPFG
jgi:hypothetical protein